MSSISVKLTPAEASVIYEFLRNTRLGERNLYENAVSNLCIRMERSGLEDYLNNWYIEHNVNRPAFKIECSEEDGLVFNVAELT
jgi:hypothetical protein